MDERVPPFRIKVGDKRSPSPWIYVIIFLLFTGILLVLFLQSSFSRIKEIQIQGNQLVPTQQILQMTQWQKGMSYFHPQPSHAKQRLEQLPEIKQVAIEKQFPNQIFINVQEYSILAYVEPTKGFQYIPILENGTTLPHRRTAEPLTFMPTIKQKEQANPTLLLALRNLQRVPRKISQEIEFVELVEDQSNQVQLISRRQHTIMVRAHDLHEKLVYYPKFYHHPPGKLYLLQSIWFSPDPISE